MRSEKQVIKKDGRFVQVVYVYDEQKGGHPVRADFRELTEEELAKYQEDLIKKEEAREAALAKIVTLEKLDAKLDLILEKLDAKEIR